MLLTISKNRNHSKEVGILIDITDWNTWVIPGEANEIETKNNPDAYRAMKGDWRQMIMEANHLSINGIYDKIQIPSRPHAADGQEPVTEEVMESRMRVAEELENLGISISKFDTEDGHEDSDELQAILLVSQGKKIPEDLKKRLMDKQKKNFEKKRVKHKVCQ